MTNLISTILGATIFKHRHCEKLHHTAAMIPYRVYAISWQSSIFYTPRWYWCAVYQSHLAPTYSQRKIPTSEHRGFITLCTLLLAPPRNDEFNIYHPRSNDFKTSSLREIASYCGNDTISDLCNFVAIFHFLYPSLILMHNVSITLSTALQTAEDSHVGA